MSGFLSVKTLGGGSYGPYVKLETNKPIRVHLLRDPNPDKEPVLQVFSHSVTGPARSGTDGQPMKPKYTEVTCLGPNSGCILCAQNQEAAKQYVLQPGEEKMPGNKKPFPVRESKLMNVWNFTTGRVEILKIKSSLWEIIKAIMEAKERNHVDPNTIDLEVTKSGQGFDTTYMATELPAQAIAVPVAPTSLHDLSKYALEGCKTDAQVKAFLSGEDPNQSFDTKDLDAGEVEPVALPAGPPVQRQAVQVLAPAPQPATASQPMTLLQAMGVVVMFGTHKGKTMGEVASKSPQEIKGMLTVRVPEIAQAAAIIIANMPKAPAEAPAGAVTPAAPQAGGDAASRHLALRKEIDVLLGNSAKFGSDFMALQNMLNSINPGAKCILTQFTEDQLKAVKEAILAA